MNRRLFLKALGVTAVGAASASGQRAYDYHLRYAPRIGLVGGIPIPRQLELYAEWGFRAFEYNSLPSHSMREIEQYRAKRDELGLAMGVFVVNSGGWKPSALVDRQFHPAFLDDVRRAVEIHSVMENEAATVSSGLAIDNLSVEQQSENSIEALKRAAEIIDDSGLMLVLEPLNVRVDHAGYFVVTTEHAHRIISAVNHPRIRMLFDIYHQQISEGDVINHIRQYWDSIGYFQVGDVPGRQEPYTGEINYRNVFRAIHEKGFQGIVGMEHSLSVPDLDGLKKCFEAYRKADTWDA